MARRRATRFSIAISDQSETTTIKCFKDTDTALFEFSDEEAAETREMTENVLIDLDKDVNPRSA